MCNGILFKLAVDEHQLYGSDANAQKATGHELKSLAAYFDCRIAGLHVPLSAVIDYRGYRVLAMSLVPVDRSTLAYGSDDGGRTVHDENPSLSRKMRDAAALLNLAGHACGVRQQKYLFAPCDIEGHLGKDGRMYVLDFARVFPPETPYIDAGAPRYKGGHLYRLLRPELVMQFDGGALSSDAFSGFGQNNMHADRLVRQATTFLYSVAIPRFAASMDRDPRLAHPIEVLHQLSHMLHRAGINVRFIGRVRHASSDSTFRSILMSEMLARTVKRHLWSSFRNIQQAQALPSEEPYTSLLIETFNLLIEDTRESADFWFKVKSDMQRYFGRMSLEPWELSPDYDLRRHCRIVVLIRRIASLCGVVLAPEALAALESDLLGRFVSADIVRLEPRVKSMNVVEISSAIALSMQAASLQQKPQEQERLFNLAYRKFESAANASPSNMTTHKYWALTLLSHGQIATVAQDRGRACALLAEADRRLSEVASALLLMQIGDSHATAVRLLASLTVDSRHAASLFARAVALGLAQIETASESVEQTVQHAQLYASHLTSGDQAYMVLNRVRETLVGLDPFKKLYNELSMNMMDLSNVGLDVSSCSEMCRQLVQDRDTKSLRHLIVSLHTRYAALPAAAVDTGLALLRMAEDALQIAPHDQVMLAARARIAIVMACGNPLVLGDKLEQTVLAAVREAGNCFEGQWEPVERLFKSFFESTLFLENSYRQRSSLPLLQLTASFLGEGFLLWDSNAGTHDSAWMPSSVVAERLMSSCAAVGRIGTTLLEQQTEAQGELLSRLTMPMLAAVVHGKPSERLRKMLDANVALLEVERAFGLTADSVAAVAACCNHVRTLTSARGCELAIAAVAPLLRHLHRIDLSALSELQNTSFLPQLFELNKATLEVLWLPGNSAPLTVVLPALVELQLGWKLSPEVVFSYLSHCPGLLRFVYRAKDNVSSVTLTRVPSARDGDDLCASWCRALNAMLRKNPQQQLREMAKALYRGYLSHNHNGLTVLGSALFHGGQLDGSVVQLVRKLGTELLGKCVASFVAHGQCDKLFDLLLVCDCLDVYDSSSVLGWFVYEMRSRLFEGDKTQFSKFLASVGPSRLSGVFASLNAALTERLMTYLLSEQPQQAESLFSQLLKLPQQNASTVFAEGLLLAKLLNNSEKFRDGVVSDVTRQVRELAEGEHVVAADLLLLVLRSEILQEHVASLPWSSLGSCKITFAAGLLDQPLLVKLIGLLPESLVSFAVRYNLHPREPIACVNEAVLSLIATRFPRLTSLELDLTPSLSSANVRMLMQSLPCLKVLQLRAPLVGDEGVEAIVEHGGIAVLRLQCAVRDILLSRMGSQMAHLQSLDLFDCPLVTVHGLERLVNNSTTLTCLRVQDCRHVKLDIIQTKLFVKVLSSHKQEGSGVFAAKSHVEYK